VNQAEFAAAYGAPWRTPPQQLRYARRAAGRLCSAIGALRRARRRRLAYLDGHFPWARSGFRYGDAIALHELPPDTVFFSMYEMTDDFPEPVQPLADFPRLAPLLGITDAYGTFLDFGLGLLGVPRPDGYPAGPIDGLDISRSWRASGSDCTSR